jgi:hypothetical protein
MDVRNRSSDQLRIAAGGLSAHNRCDPPKSMHE